jgi:hypothetical protein
VHQVKNKAMVAKTIAALPVMIVSVPVKEANVSTGHFYHQYSNIFACKEEA